MRICRYSHRDRQSVGFYDESRIVPIFTAAGAYSDATRSAVDVGSESSLHESSLLDFLPPDGKHWPAAAKIADWVSQNGGGLPAEASIPLSEARLLVPLPRPNKLFLLAGNYAKHIEEGGGIAAERSQTFPYVFMKPPTTTLTDPGEPVVIPAISPNTIDWELELAVIIGREVKGVSEAEALDAVAGYTIINDISNRKFRPNTNRKQREKDSFFDWLHGKWFDSFCPCGPCVTSADSVDDPQQLKLELRVNGDLKQDSNTAHQIFPVAAVIEFISSIVTLEPGDIISTGTPSGVGNTTGTYLAPGDAIDASIGSIGTLSSPVIAEQG